MGLRSWSHPAPELLDAARAHPHESMMPTVYQPFEAERLNREIEVVGSSAMKGAAEADRDQMISNIKSGVSPIGGGPQKSNSPVTIRMKGSSTPLIGKGRTLVKSGNYRIREISDPSMTGYELLPPVNREAILIKLAGQGYPVFYLDQTQVMIGEKMLVEAIERMSDSFRGPPK